MEGHINDLDAKGFMRMENGHTKAFWCILDLPKHNTYLVLFQTKLVSLTIKSPLLEISDAARFRNIRM